MKFRKHIIKLSLILASTLFSEAVFAAAEYASGTIVNHSSSPDGLMIQISSPVPTNCSGTGYNWLLIPEKNKSMVAVTLLAILQGKSVTVYAPPRGTAYYCSLTQVDPS